MNPYEVLRSMLAHDPELWKPNEGDSLVGQVIARSVYHHDKWGDSPMVKVRDEHGRLWRWYALATVPKNELGWQMDDDGDRYGPDAIRVGDWLGAIYLGRDRTGDGTEFERWRIAVVRQADIEAFSDAVVSPQPAPERESSRGRTASLPAAPPTSSSGDTAPKQAPKQTSNLGDAQRAELEELFARFSRVDRVRVKGLFKERFGVPDEMDAAEFPFARAFLEDELGDG